DPREEGAARAAGPDHRRSGSTGLATGPHVCFRFWKHGQQVDHRKEEMPSAEPVAKADRFKFEMQRDMLLAQLDEAARHGQHTSIATF
ncbi:MAG TPA: hypothetical protein PJ983_13245, partial [Flavobacteriales bacterium]|nr:hypothetical protein [Flavobacteriales bacterium]